MSSLSSKSGNLKERMKHLLITGDKADLQFLVGEGEGKELFRAHKVIITGSSDVFKAMIDFDSKSERNENGPIEITDISANAFKVMLSFIYTDDLSELDGDNAMDVFYAAKKYNIASLIDQSRQKIPMPNHNTVFLLYAQARLFDLEDLAKNCMDYIEKNAKDLFESEQFLQVDQNLLCEILDKLRSISELCIWEAAFRWADEKCRQNSIECTGESCRAVLGPALYKIRFPLMTKEDFLKIPSDLLTMEEMLGIYQFHCHPPNSPGAFQLKFSSQGRICDRNEGTILLDIEISEFAREHFGSERSSETVHIKGLPWKILARKIENENNFGIFLCCTASEKDPNWSYKCSATFRIVSQKNETEHFTWNSIDHIFNNKSRTLAFPTLFSFERLMDSSKGLHINKEDKLTLAIDLTEVEKFDTNPNKSNGTIVMKIDNLSEFAREFCGSERSSTNAVSIGGFPWKINAKIKGEKSEKCLGFYLKCAAPTKYMNWSLHCSATFQIVSRIRFFMVDLIGKFNDRIFSNEITEWGFDKFITFSKLMDNRRLYDKEEDKLTLAIDIFVEEKKMDKFVSDPNKSTGKIVLEIGNLLEFKREICGSERRSETVLIGGLPWKILAKIKEGHIIKKHLYLYLCCAAPNENENWNCKFSANFRIVSQNSGTKDLKKQFNEKRLNSKTNSCELFSFPFGSFMGPISEAFYYRNSDNFTVEIEVILAKKSVKFI
ncbi:hypothetical protein niasHT_014182 [Heterodera trifolii]|uniref:BTB/POZ domain-containing protein n=1 Tax=Heterodera trifolii TaxID=157864 RepID=A0ABD2KWY5_9BILA